MKNSKINIVLFLAIMLIISSCGKDFLDLKPLDQEVSSNFYESERDAMEALIAVYDVLNYQTSAEGAWAPFVTVSDILSDDAFAGGADANDGFDENELNTHLIPTTNLIVHTIWLNNYVGIYRANLLLEVIDDIDASDEFKARIIAECKFLRAYFHFQLVQFFENVPLLTATIKGPSEYIQDQDSPEEVYNQIALDLTEAMEDLPEMIPASDAGRISKWAAKAFLGRVFLFYNGVYGQNLMAGNVVIDRSRALQELEEVIGSSGHDLLPNYGDNFKPAGEFGMESVFEISYGDTPPWWDWNYVRGGKGNLSSQLQGQECGSNKWDRGWSFAPVSQKLVNDMEGDPRIEFTILFEDELDGVLTKGYQHTGYFSKKYTSDADHWGTDGQFELNRSTNHRVIRFSDVLLMAAELGSGNAQSYMDRVRSRVGLGSMPATFENIMNERRMELSLEGHRYFDLLRQGMAVASTELMKSGERGPKYEGDQVLFNVNFNTATRGFLPIPQTEIDLLGGTFRQNSGY